MTGETLMSCVRVAVILPSRGLMFSRTAEEILNNLKGISHKIFFSHRKPLPDCFEIPTKKALQDDSFTHLWFVEDDMILPSDTLQTMLDMNVAVVTADYPINRQGRGAVFRDKGGKILITGTGCLLVKREVMAEMKPPYFRDDMRWIIKNMGDYVKLVRTQSEHKDGYGLHDVNFCMNLHRLEIPIHCIDTILGQRKLIALGKAGSNNGAHKIEQWTKVKKNHLLKEIMRWPVTETGNLETVMTPTGEIQTSKEHAKKLIKVGLGHKPAKRYSVIDWNVEQ